MYKWESVEELTEAAGNATKQPLPPDGKIPKQWLPGIIRWPIRALLLPFVLLDLASQRFARQIVRPPFRQEGHCHQRGNCCYYVLIPEPKGIIARLFYFWYTQINGFYLRQKEPIKSEGKNMVIMGCRYLQKNGRCGHYRLRPTLCREWPLIRYFGYPRILKGCGFRATTDNNA
jgi:hypothetical protein